MAFTGTRNPVEKEVVPLPPEVVGRFWKDVRSILHRHWRESRDLENYDDERLHGRLLVGMDTAWLVIQDREAHPLQGLIVTSIAERPPSLRRCFRRERSLIVHVAGGENIGTWIEQAAERISHYGQVHGCRQVFILARKGWQTYVHCFLNHGWDKVAFSRDRPMAYGGRRLRNRVGYYRVLGTPEVRHVPFQRQQH